VLNSSTSSKSKSCRAGWLSFHGEVVSPCISSFFSPSSYRATSVSCSMMNDDYVGRVMMLNDNNR
jgi:hypothetical protein